MHIRHKAKLSAYVLACEGLHKVLPDLYTAAQDTNDSRLNVLGLIGAFEIRVQEFFGSCKETDHAAAAFRLAQKVSELGDLARDLNAEAGAIWDRYSIALKDKIPAWNFVAHVQELHDVGRGLAREFFANCAPLLGRLKVDCRCQVRCNESERSIPPMLFSHSSALIEAIFSFESNEPHFRWYVALPFRFLHEYTAHIFAIDTRYQVFSDGWMLVAASRFLERRWLAADGEFPLSEDQVYVFRKALEHMLSPVSQRGIRVARLFEAIVESEGRAVLFVETTDALCSLENAEPLARLEYTARFLRNLERLFSTRDGRNHVRRLTTVNGEEFLRVVTLQF
ncbi:MAG TPA: hypothetical protein VJU77_03425 [Chthoniobacterales bacterium]|nr:hypothetical protein [Chthoniobacterales bacterium]